jgi:hypothetical protein
MLIYLQKGHGNRMDVLVSLFEEAERVRATLRLLQEYDYKTAVLDVLRTIELAADELLYAADDPWRVIGIAQVGQQSFGRILDWLPTRNCNWTYRPSKDSLDEHRILACRDAFQFAFYFEILSSAERLYREGLLTYKYDGNCISFSRTSLRLSFLRGAVDNVVSDRARPNPRGPANELRTLDEVRVFTRAVAEITARDLIDELDLYPEEIRINGYTIGQFKAVWQALTINALMWRARPQRNSLSVPQRDQLREAVKVMRLTEFVHNLADETHLGRQVVRDVVEDLLFRKELGLRLNVWTNPLIPLGAKHIAFVPRLFTTNRIGRNFPKIWLKRHPARYHFITGSRVLESTYIAKICKLLGPLADPNFIVSNKHLPSVSGQGTEVDLAFVDRSHETLLIIETKYIIAPDSLREQRNAQDAAVTGVSQVKRILEWARANPVAAFAALFGRTCSTPEVKQISGIVICNWSYGPEETTDIPVVSHYGIVQRMQARTRPETASALLESLRDIRTVNLDVEELRYSEYEFTIGKFQVRMPVTHYFTVATE